MPQSVSVKSLLQIVRQTPYIVGYLFFTVVTRRQPIVLFLSVSSDRLVGNMAAVHDELTERGIPIEAVLRKSLRHRLPFRERVRLCAVMARASVIIVDDFYPMIYQIPLRRGTQLIQLWHASGAFKTMGFSRAGKPGGPIKGSRTHKNYSAAITSSEQVRKNYAEAFGISIDKVHATGIPRTDPFFDDSIIERSTMRVRDELSIPDGHRLLLFAPTFRGNGQLSAYYNDEWIDWTDLADRLGPGWVIGYRPHPFVTSRPQALSDPRFRDLSGWSDTTSLLMATDVLVTDYSSIIFDFALLGRPTVFFCPDLEEYIAARDFYYPYDWYTYGPVARTHEDLVAHVTHGTWDTAAHDDFLTFFCGACDGQATARVVDTLIAPHLQGGGRS